MRITRIVTALVAAFTAAMLGFTLAPANAAAAPVATKAAAKPKHVIENLSAGKASARKFYAKGNAVTFKGKKIKLQRQLKGSSRWVTVQQKKTKPANGKFNFKFSGKCGTKFRLVLKATSTYKKTNVKLGKIVCY